MSAPSAIGGDVATVEQLASRLSGVADETAYAASRLDRLHAGTWLGAAADTFGEKSGQLPPKLHAAADAFRSAESAYRSYAADLSHGQSEALRAMSLWSSGVSATSCWQAQVAALPANDPGRAVADPGACLRDQASVVYRDAADLVDASARRAADTLHQAAALAPHGPGFWSQAWHAATSFADGMWDGTVGIVKMAWEFSPIRLMIDPHGWAHDTETMGKALYWGATHPVDFGKAIADNFLDDPAHALGELVPGLVLAAATGGGSLAANAVRTGAERATTLAVTTAAKLALRVAQVGGDAGEVSLNLVTLGLTGRVNTARVVRELIRQVEATTPLRFKPLSHGTYRSPAGLIYERTNIAALRHRVLHVLAHGLPNDAKPTHTRFRPGEDIMAVIDEAWLRRGQPDLDDPARYVIDMGRPVGLAGEEKVVIIVRDSKRVITSFPIK
ncbi:MAG: hypothetical protein JWM93_2845 [Frankiales bacterium]|nr:hypothetical protein [Frankiales bacterium]